MAPLGRSHPSSDSAEHAIAMATRHCGDAGDRTLWRQDTVATGGALPSDVWTSSCQAYLVEMGDWRVCYVGATRVAGVASAARGADRSGSGRS